MIDIAEILKDAVWDQEEPAKPASIQKLVDNAGKELPEAYLALLSYSDGGDGVLGIEPGWLQLWSSADDSASCNPGVKRQNTDFGFRDT